MRTYSVTISDEIAADFERRAAIEGRSVEELIALALDPQRTSAFFDDLATIDNGSALTEGVRLEANTTLRDILDAA